MKPNYLARTADFEGFKPSIYKDTKGKRTIGYGFNLDDPYVKRELKKQGYNVSNLIKGAESLTEQESQKLLSHFYDHSYKSASRIVKNFKNLPENVQHNLADLNYNLGTTKLLKFRKMLGAIENYDFQKAAAELKDSDYYNQTKRRGKALYEDFLSTKPVQPPAQEAVEPVEEPGLYTQARAAFSQAAPFIPGGELVNKLLPYAQGGLIKRKDGSYSKRGLWDNIRANRGSGRKPTKEMLRQERKIRAAEKKEDGGPVYNWIPPNYPRVGARNEQGSWLDQYAEGGDVAHDYMYNEGNVSSYLPGTSVHPAGITNVPDSPCGPGFTIQYDETGNPVCMPIATPAPSAPSAPSAPTPVLAGANAMDYMLFNPAVYSSAPLATYSVERIRRGRDKGDRSKPTREERREARLSNKALKGSDLHRRPFLSGVGQFFRNIGNAVQRCLPGDDCYKFEAGGDVKKYARKGEIYNERRADELGYTPDATGHLPSVDYETSEWLKSAQHPTAWKEHLYGYTLNPAVSSGYNLGFDFGGYFGKNQLKYYPKKEDGSWVADSSIPTPTSPSSYPAYPDKTLTNYQMGTPKSNLPIRGLRDATPKIPAYAHGATVYTNQDAATWVNGTEQIGTQDTRHPKRNTRTESPATARTYPEIKITGPTDPYSPSSNVMKGYNPWNGPMRLHAPDTTMIAKNGGYVPMYKKGGFLSAVGDVGLGIVDSTLGSVGSVTGIKSMQDIIDEDQYADDKFDDVAGFAGKIAGTALKVIPVTAPFAAAAGAVGTVANKALKIDEKNYDPTQHTSAWDKWGSGIESVGSIASMAMGNVSGAAGAAGNISKAAEMANTISKGANLVNAGMNVAQGLGQGQVDAGSILNMASSLQGLQGGSGLNKTGNLGGTGDVVSGSGMLMAKHGGRIPGLRWQQLNFGVSPPAHMYSGPTTQRGITFANGGPVRFSVAGENHKVYIKESPTGNGKGVKGHVMVNHPTEDKGKWDTIDLTEKVGAKTVAQGVAATKQWHKENPYYADGGDILEVKPMLAAGPSVGLSKDPRQPKLGAVGMGYAGGKYNPYIQGKAGIQGGSLEAGVSPYIRMDRNFILNPSLGGGVSTAGLYGKAGLTGMYNLPNNLNFDLYGSAEYMRDARGNSLPIEVGTAWSDANPFVRTGISYDPLQKTMGVNINVPIGAERNLFKYKAKPKPIPTPRYQAAEKKADGGNIPSRQDSISLLNSVNALNKYYQTSGFHEPQPYVFSPSYFNTQAGRASLNQEEEENIRQYNYMLKDFEASGKNSKLYKDYKQRDPSMTPEKYAQLIKGAITQTKDNNPYKRYYRDLYPSKIDIEAPAAIIDTRIQPQALMEYRAAAVPSSEKAKRFLKNSSTQYHQSELSEGPAGMASAFYYYDPIAITPWDILTESQKKERVKKYGVTGTPLPSIKKSEKPKPKPETLQFMSMRSMPSFEIEEAVPRKTKVPAQSSIPTQYMDTRGEWSDKPQVPPVYTEEQLLKMGYRAPKKKNGGWLDNL